jgi:hypothetical protein
MSTKSHTIRFDEDEKEEIRLLGEIQGRKFQAQVDWMLKQQLKNQRVLLFLNRVQCALENMEEHNRNSLMAKIANIVNIELE